MAEAAVVSERIERRTRSVESPSLEEIEARQDTLPGIIEPAEDKQPTPEEALAEAQKLLTERDAELARERQTRETLQRERDDANQRVQDTSSARLTDQESAINSAIEAGTAAKNAAITRIRAAREAGDFSAEMEASTEFNAAEYRLNRAKDVKANFEANFEAWKAKQPKPGERRQPVQQAGQPTSEAQKWLDDHPRYYADDDYKADAIASHNLAMEKNIPEGSKAYIAFIEARMERLYGDDHGRIGGPAREAKPNGGTVTNGRQTQRSASSTAAPPSRSSSSSGGGGSIEYTHPQGSIRLVTILNDKGQHVETVQGIIPTEWRNAAQWTGMDDVQYAVSQLKFQQ
jgi:hypothetical protein